VATVPQAALEKVGADNEESYIFMETAVDFFKHKHAYIECIPMEKELAFDAPMYFSKVCVWGWGALLVCPRVCRCA
jgi:hypothetical protein